MSMDVAMGMGNGVRSETRLPEMVEVGGMEEVIKTEQNLKP